MIREVLSNKIQANHFSAPSPSQGEGWEGVEASRSARLPAWRWRSTAALALPARKGEPTAQAARKLKIIGKSGTLMPASRVKGGNARQPSMASGFRKSLPDDGRHFGRRLGRTQYTHLTPGNEPPIRVPPEIDVPDAVRSRRIGTVRRPAGAHTQCNA